MKAGACSAENVNGLEPKVWLDPADEGGCNDADYAHVLGHALGLIHTFQRHDRDRYLRVDAANAGCDCVSDVLQACGPRFGAIGPFDYESLMTYSPGTAEPGFFTDKKGNVLARASVPSALDGSAVIEISAWRGGWQPFVAVGVAAEGSTLDPRLPGGHGLLGSPAATVTPFESASGGTLHLLVRGENNHLYEKAASRPWTSGQDPLPAFDPSWVDLGGDFDSDPAATSGHDGRYYVAARRTDGQVYILASDDPRWASLGAPPAGAASAPALAASAPGRVDVVVRGGDDAVWLRTFDAGAWKEWRSFPPVMGGAPTLIEGKPAMASWGGGRIDIVAKAKGIERIMHMPRNPIVTYCPAERDWWCAPNFPNAYAAEGPSLAIVTAGYDKLDVFIAGAGGMLSQMQHYDDKWQTNPQAWAPLGGIINGAPAAVAWPDGTITVYAFGLARPSGDLLEAPVPILLERSWRRNGEPPRHSSGP